MTEPDAYDAAVQALFARRPDVMVPGLGRIRALSARLGDPHLAYPAVHVTGTNGKTSVARMVGALLQASGRRVGTYTSPHLQDVRERIRLDSAPISRAELLRGLALLAPHLDAVERQGGEMVTFFEALTGLAFATFARAQVQVGVFEVGMGGRWDATNLVDGRVAVLNRVGLDHAELGSTLEDVAAEKTGIIKARAVVISASQEPVVAGMIERTAAEHDARLLVMGRDFAVGSRSATVGGQRLILHGIDGHRLTVHLPVRGAHQAANAACALAAVQALLAEHAPRPSTMRAGFLSVRSPGRLELFARDGEAPVVLDGAHNPDGARSLVTALRDEFGYRRCVLVLGVMGDKDVEQILATVLAVADGLVVTQAASSRAAPAERLAKLARLAGRAVAVAPDVPTALAVASRLAGPEDLVVVTGSLYTVGEARSALGGVIT